MSRLIQLTQEEILLLNLTKLGEFLVLGLHIIESDDQSIEINKELVGKALIFLQKRHPLMRATLEFDSNNNNKAFFKLNESCEINSDDDIEYAFLESKDKLISKLEIFNGKLFDYSKKNSKLWRTCIYVYDESGSKRYAVGIVMPLFVTDGINITVVLTELINIVNSLVKNIECIEMRVRLELIANMDELIKEKNLLTVKKIEHLKRVLQSKRRLDFKLSPKFKNTNETGFKLNLFCIDSDLTAQIIKANKNNKTKLTAYLTMIGFYALNDLYTEENIILPKDLCFGLAANLRFRVEPKIDFSHIRYLVPYIEPRILFSEFELFQDFWKDVHTVDCIVAEATSIETGALFEYVHNLEGLNDFNKIFETSTNENEIINLVNSESTCDFGISNTGTYAYNEKRPNPSTPFRINETYFTDSICNLKPLNAAALFFHVSYWNEKLMFSLCSNKSTIGSIYTERYIQLYQENLSKSINSFKH